MSPALLNFRKIALCLLCLILRVAATEATPPWTTNEPENGTWETSPEYNESYELEFELSRLKDWSYYDYSSKEHHARPSIVKWGGKIYDPLSFKGAANDSFAVSFHLSTEVVVSAAQSRNGTLFQVAIIHPKDEYKEMMAQIQQDLKGDRSLYYTETDSNPGWNWDDSLGISRYSAYFRRLYNYLRKGPPPPFSPDPTPIFASVLKSLKAATEEALGVKVNHTATRYDKGLRLSSPFEFNETFIGSLDRAMNSLTPNASKFSYIGPSVRPYTKWDDHSSDILDYGGENGTELAMEQAMKGAEMMEFDLEYRYGDPYCGSYLVEEDMRIENEKRANGTWAAPIMKRRVPWECEDWESCWRAWPWKWRMNRRN